MARPHCLVSLLLAGALQAQPPIEIRVGDSGAVRGEVELTAGSWQGGAYGHATVRLHNDDGEAHEVAIRLHSHPWASIRFSATRPLTLEPGEAARVLLPLPGTAQPDILLSVEVRGGDERYEHNLGLGASAGPAVLCVTDASKTASAWQTRLEELARAAFPGTPGGGAALSLFHVRNAAALPDRWQYLSGFDAVVVDGRTPGLDEAAQQVLADYAAAGGQLIASDPAALASGVLRTQLEPALGTIEDQGFAPRQHRFGGVLAFAGSDALHDARAAAALAHFLEATFDSSKKPQLRLPHPALRGIEQAAGIPGLGAIPVQAFFLFILGFAIAAGPVNFFVARRRRQPALMLLTLPALGIGCTVLVLLWGILSEGLGVKGTLTTVTFLDQQRHEATTVAARTLYAGLSPAALHPAAGTNVTSPDLYEGQQAAHSLDFDLDTGRIGGGLLPARTPTTLLTVSQGPCRERLRFARSSNGTLEVLAGTSLSPVSGHDTLLLRDAAGDLYQSQADGRLHLVRNAAAALQAIALRAMLGSDLAEQTVPTMPPGQTPLEHLLDSSLEPGTWIAAVHGDPALDTLGLEVAWLRTGHVVIGRLAKGDILD